jgi:Tol biopolymer transport system component
LFASFNDGAEIIQLSDELVEGGNVVEFKISPDGIYVAYVADQDENNLFELYVVPVDKATDEAAVKVSVPLAGRGIRETAPGSGRYFFDWALDSSRVAYIADAAEVPPSPEIVNFFALFSSTPDGETKDVVSDLLRTNSDVQDFDWEPDSNLIAYVADQDRDDKFELYVARSDGAVPSRRVSGVPMAGNGVREILAGSGQYAFGWAPDSSRLGYIADQDIPGKFELFTSTPNGGSNAKVSKLPAGPRNVATFKWAPNSQRIAYTANQNIADAIDLFATLPVVGTTPVILSSGMKPGGEVADFKWAPDSSRIAFIVDKSGAAIFELWSVQPVNSNDVLISGSLATTSDVTIFKWAPNSSRIAYIVDAVNFELFTTEPTRLSSTRIRDTRATADSDVFDFDWSPNSSRVAYTADFIVSTVSELFSSTFDNRETDRVSGSLTAGGDVGKFKWAFDNSGVGYIADQDTEDVDELYASRPNGNDNTLLSGDLVRGGDVLEFDWVP